MKKIISFMIILSVIVAMSSCSIPLFCEHNYESTVVEQTIFDYGYVIYKCSKCGDEYQETALPSLYSRAQELRATIVNRLKESLVDPDSLIYSCTCFCDNDLQDEHFGSLSAQDAVYVYFTFKWNAKNRLGGYVGYKYTTYNVGIYINKLSDRFLIGEANSYINYNSEKHIELFNFS